MRLCWLFFIYPHLIIIVIFLFLFLVSEHLSSTLLVPVTIEKASRFKHFVCIESSLHNNVKHASNNRKENGRERARAEEIEAKFFFFLSWLCPISFLFFLMNFWISFIALQIRNDPFLRIWEDLFVTRLAGEFDGAFHRSIGSMYASTHAEIKCGNCEFLWRPKTVYSLRSENDFPTLELGTQTYWKTFTS